MCVGTGWCATDGVEDAHRVGQSAPRAVLHWVYLGKNDQLGRLDKGIHLILFKSETHTCMLM